MISGVWPGFAGVAEGCGGQRAQPSLLSRQGWCKWLAHDCESRRVPESRVREMSGSRSRELQGREGAGESWRRLHSPTGCYSHWWATVPKRQTQNPRANVLQVREWDKEYLGQPGCWGHSLGIGRKTDDFIPQSPFWKPLSSFLLL